MNSKLREALKEAHAMLKRIHNAYSDSNEDVTIYQLRKTIAAVEPALAEPLRNCDVGTAEEQTERFRKFCFAHTHKNGTDFRCHKNCPAKNYIGGWGIPYCQLKWAQLPYESEVK